MLKLEDDITVGHKRYKSCVGYPKPIHQDFPLAPGYVNAAIANDDKQVFLLILDTMYKYTKSGDNPEMSFSYEIVFDLTQNSLDNPFRVNPAGGENGPDDLFHAPSGITALYRRVLDGQLLAFVGTQLYQFLSGRWSYLGEAKPLRHHVMYFLTYNQ